MYMYVYVYICINIHIEISANTHGFKSTHFPDVIRQDSTS